MDFLIIERYRQLRYFGMEYRCVSKMNQISFIIRFSKFVTPPKKLFKIRH